MKRYILKYSIVASFEGINPGKWFHCETSPHDVCNAWPLAHDATLDVVTCETKEQLEENPSEYDSELWMNADWEHGDKVQFVKCSGILSRDECFSFLDSIGANYEKCETMGTLGGPLGCTIVPDFPFMTESQLMVSSIRITPVLCDAQGEPKAIPSESSWHRFKALLEKYDCFDLATSGRAVSS